jgi:NAD(P)-dependent dehydrogenase (short-subunit alcohol dehydrogenase family)
MGSSNKFLVAGAAACALAATPIAVAAVGPTATTTPTHPKLGASVAMTLKGMKAGEKIKAAELAPFGQKRTLYPAKRVNAAGTIVVTVKAQVKGKHTWTFTGRTSRKTVKTSYVVK